MNYKAKVNPNIVNPSMINPDLAKDVRNPRLHEVACLLKMAIFRLHLRERNNLIKKLSGL